LIQHPQQRIENPERMLKQIAVGLPGADLRAPSEAGTVRDRFVFRLQIAAPCAFIRGGEQFATWHGIPDGMHGAMVAAT
jgi:hypothetical protein